MEPRFNYDGAPVGGKVREIRHLPEKFIYDSFILEPFGRKMAVAIAAFGLQGAKKSGRARNDAFAEVDHLISLQQFITIALFSPLKR